jgi:hypothetical protein
VEEEEEYESRVLCGLNYGFGRLRNSGLRLGTSPMLKMTRIGCAISSAIYICRYWKLEIAAVLVLNF